MITTKIKTEPAVAEYIRGRYFDEAAGCVRFPSGHDIYETIYNLMQRRPETNPVDCGNLEFALPDKREGREAAGKNPETFNYLSQRSGEILAARMKLMMWADLHDFMDENKHARGVQFKDSAHEFMTRYGVESVSVDALLKNYQRWREKMRRRSKREYHRRK